MRTFLLAVLLACCLGTSSEVVVSAQVSVDSSRFAKIDEVINADIADKKLPGAVVVVGQGDAIHYRKVYGNRALVPAVEPMTMDTVFDMASLTKVVATTSAVMMLVEDGRIRLSDPVAQFIPEFAKYGKNRVTIRHLLTHMSGLRPDVDLADPWVGYDAAIQLANEEVLMAPPGRNFVYSDIGFFLLADIVSRVSGQKFEAFVDARLFKPLGMSDTGFLPAATLRERIAPTEVCTPYGWPCAGPDARMLRGTVHDPTARRMGGVAGHAGLFSTANDMVRFARMLLRGGRARRRSCDVAADGGPHDQPIHARGRSQRAWTRVGHGLVVFVEPR
jgi:CubicO group peptidase (beta-lactamase class C family)